MKHGQRDPFKWNAHRWVAEAQVNGIWMFEGGATEKQARDKMFERFKQNGMQKLFGTSNVVVRNFRAES